MPSHQLLGRTYLLLAVFGLTSPVRASEKLPWILEWTDQARDRKAMFGDPLHLRNLYCWSVPRQGALSCELSVVRVFRGCPLRIDHEGYRTDKGAGLRVTRTGDYLEIEFASIQADVKIRIALMDDRAKLKMVAHATGTMVFRAEEGGPPARVVELEGLSKDSKGLERYPEHLDVDLNCSRIQVAAAKGNP